ncbi:MAG: DUF1731 domain-containing protein, partial [Armatimonadetes bacterium]|nr:DUF1731 domain-containing protein [Armatimonadota bacterium]
SMTGPVNVCSPNPVTNSDFTRILGRVISRPTPLPAPAFALRLLFGEVADEMLLSSIRMRPVKLLETGYPFTDPGLEGGLRRLLRK